MIKTKVGLWPYAWHEWFAWYPKEIEHKIEGNQYTQTWVWWETVWRKWYESWGGSNYEYSLEQPSGDCSCCHTPSNSCPSFLDGKKCCSKCNHN